MYEDDNPQNERIKSWDAFWGYMPFWELDFSIKPPFENYETTYLGKRYEHQGNMLHGNFFVWGLNHKG